MEEKGRRISYKSRVALLSQSNNHTEIKKKEWINHSFFLVVEVTGFEHATSASRTQRSTKLSHTSIKMPRQVSVEAVAAELGFEPRQTESESAVLPLHNSAIFIFRCLSDNDVIISLFSRKSIPFFKKIIKFFEVCTCSM